MADIPSWCGKTTPHVPHAGCIGVSESQMVRTPMGWMVQEKPQRINVIPRGGGTPTMTSLPDAYAEHVRQAGTVAPEDIWKFRPIAAESDGPDSAALDEGRRQWGA